MKKEFVLVDDVAQTIIGFYPSEQKAIAAGEKLSALDLRYRSVWGVRVQISATGAVKVRRFT
jgi:hypothetical protein